MNFFELSDSNCSFIYVDHTTISQQQNNMTDAYTENCRQLVITRREILGGYR